MNPWQDRYPDALRLDPIGHLAALYPNVRGNPPPEIEVVRFPKLSRRENQEEPWRGANRVVSYSTFALIENRYYDVFQTKFVDAIVVVDTGRPVGDDLCYLRPALLP